jgi:hypothetical protein
LLKHKFVRGLLLLTGILSFGIIIVIIKTGNLTTSNAWGAIAGSLAVMTAIISAWNTERMVEKQEEALKPYPYPFIDDSSRYGLTQLVVKNFGGSTAHNIKLIWDTPLLNHKGEEVRFSGLNSELDIKVLLPGDSISTLIGASFDLFSDQENKNYSGTIIFENEIGKMYSYEFLISIEQYRKTLISKDEKPKTLRKLQDVPDEISKLTRELKEVSKTLQKVYSISNEDD